MSSEQSRSTIQPLEMDNAHLAYLAALDQAWQDDCSPMDAEERAVKAALAWLQQDFLRQTEPWIKRLTEIETRKPMHPIILPDGSITIGR